MPVVEVSHPCGNVMGLSVALIQEQVGDGAVAPRTLRFGVARNLETPWLLTSDPHKEAHGTCKLSNRTGSHAGDPAPLPNYQDPRVNGCELCSLDGHWLPEEPTCWPSGT